MKKFFFNILIPATAWVLILPQLSAGTYALGLAVILLTWSLMYNISRYYK